MRAALDTNVLVYAEGVNGAVKRDAALDVIQRLPLGTTVLPAQALGELFNVLIRKAGRSAASARTVILNWQDAFAVADTSAAVIASAADLATDHQLSIWDAVILSAAADAECRLLLSEDLQEGFTWSGVTVTNPFSTPRHELLEALLKQE